MRDTLTIGMGRTLAQVMAVFAVVFGLLNAQCLAVCTARSCKNDSGPVAPVTRADSHCHPAPAKEEPTSPAKSKGCAHETIERATWQEVKPVVLSFTPSVELYHFPANAPFTLPRGREIICLHSASPPSAGNVQTSVLRI
jgi:hypothetical protein